LSAIVFNGLSVWPICCGINSCFPTKWQFLFSYKSLVRSNDAMFTEYFIGTARALDMCVYVCKRITAEMVSVRTS